MIVALGGAAAWPLAASAQQQAMPVVGALLTGPAHRAAAGVLGLGDDYLLFGGGAML